MAISGANSILIDDFSFVEVIEQPEETPTVDIAENTASVEEEKTTQLHVTVMPAGKAVEWTSSNNAIATVDQNGVVTGVKAGIATITAKVADGIVDTCTVTVTEAVPETTATEIVLKDTTLHLAPKAYHVLSVKAGAGGGQVGTINWSSNADSVATVDATGKVTAVADGTATITATIPTSDKDKPVKAIATVTVEGAESILKNGSFDVKDDTSWNLENATVKPNIGINNSNALVFGSGSKATQIFKDLKPGTVYIARVNSYSIGQLGASIKVTQEGMETPLFNSTVPTTEGWNTPTFEFVIPDNYDGSPLTFEMTAGTSGTALYLDNISITEGYSDADLIVSDIMWNNDETQIKPGTPVNFSLVIGNIGTEATKVNRDIVVELRVNAKTIRTYVHKGGKEYGELLFEAQTLLGTVESFVSYYAFDEYGEPYTTVDETNYDWILTAEEEWNSLTDVEREAINKKALELCGMTFEEMLAMALEIAEGGEGEIPSPEDGVPFPMVALVGLALGGAAMIAGKKRRDEE